MIKATRQISLGMALLALSLGGCGRKETGPEESDVVAEAPATATPIPPATEDPAATKPLLDFDGMDADRDGKVSSAENAKAAQTIFAALDADRDGTVTLAEMDAARDAIGERPDLSSEKLIEQADADHDGKLTLGEWVAASNGRFARFDRNADGALDRDEWRAGLAAEAGKPAQP